MKKSINYIVNDKKTDDSTLITGLNCSIYPGTAAKEMELVKKKFGKENGILAFHFIQSFKPGEISDYKTAHEIGVKFAERITNHEYKALVSTHVDKEHIHNHIIINSVNSITGKKYNSCKAELEVVRNYSDELCKEYDLSIITPNPKNRTKSYKEWMEDKNGTSWKTQIKYEIDKTISQVNSFDEFISALESKGYAVKYKNLKHIAFKAPGQQRFARGYKIGAEYTEESIRNRIKNKEIDMVKFKDKDKVKWIDFDVYRFRHAKGTLINNIALTAIIIKNMLGIHSENRRNRHATNYNNYAINTLRKLEKTLQSLDGKNIDTREKIFDNIDKCNSKLKGLNKNRNDLDLELDKLKELEIVLDKFDRQKEDYKIYNSSFVNKIKFKDKLASIKKDLKILKKNNLDGDDGRKILISQQQKKYSEIKQIADEINKVAYLKDEYLEDLDVVDKVNSQEYITSLQDEEQTLNNIIENAEYDLEVEMEQEQEKEEVEKEKE